MPSIFKLHSKFKTCRILGWNYALLHSHSQYTQYHLEHYQYSYFHYQLYKFWLSETLELTSHCPKFVQNASFITFRTSFKLSKMQAFHPLELTPSLPIYELYNLLNLPQKVQNIQYVHVQKKQLSRIGFYEDYG